MAAGAITGVAVSVLMATLGAALGFTATAAAVDTARDLAASAEGVGKAAVGFGIAAGIWLLVSSALVGVVGGSVLAKLAHAGRAYYPGAHGFLTWALGVAIAVLFAASGSGAISAALGIGAAGAAGTAATARPDLRATPSSADSRVDGTRPAAPTENRGAVPADAGFERTAPVMTPAEREAAVRAAELAATAAATAAWFALFALLIGLATTLAAASRRKQQVDPQLGRAQAV